MGWVPPCCWSTSWLRERKVCVAGNGNSELLDALAATARSWINSGFRVNAQDKTDR